LISPLFTGNRPPQSPRQWHRNCLRVGVGPPHGRADRLCQSRNTSSGSIDVRAIRLSTTGGIAVTQQGFADAIGVPVKTLRNWEQGRRQPTGPARVLLALIARSWPRYASGVIFPGKVSARDGKSFSGRCRRSQLGCASSPDEDGSNSPVCPLRPEIGQAGMAWT
jgi:DNA-binding transcriptional regulator YiaG